ncbi:MAG: hypothetical protein K6D97_06400 [Clostridia bacterium]|nr:hypothetical protein [Clostridia bacterium]
MSIKQENEITVKIILRYNVEGDKVLQRITFKKKDIAKNGDIVNQTAINCDVYNIEEAKIEKIKNKICELNLPIANDDFFIKKAENELNKILRR